VGYPLEWDDFVSWPHANPNIEVIRNALAATEPLLLSKIPEQIRRGVEIVVSERNRAAALLGIAERAPPHHQTSSAT
jgi:hypothetical protein